MPYSSHSVSSPNCSWWACREVREIYISLTEETKAGAGGKQTMTEKRERYHH